MSSASIPNASQLRLELGLRNRRYARGRAHAESYGGFPVIVYAPQESLHGNFFEPAYAAITARPEWVKRFDKIHAQARSLPKAERRWRELDSSMSSDALLMNIFCTPGVIESTTMNRLLGVDCGDLPIFGWKARVPLASGRFDRTEVDMRWGDLLVESKLTESDFQCREVAIVESYRDFDDVFDRDFLPRAEIRFKRRREAVELAEEFTQEWEPPCEDDGAEARAFQAKIVQRTDQLQPRAPAYTSYQLIRNVLAAHAQHASFCVIHDARRPDLREAWFQVMAAVKTSDLRGRCKVLTWQELVPLLPEGLQEFLDFKYGIVAPGYIPSPLDEASFER
jgi:hypothetical protein